MVGITEIKVADPVGAKPEAPNAETPPTFIKKATQPLTKVFECATQVGEKIAEFIKKLSQTSSLTSDMKEYIKQIYEQNIAFVNNGLANVKEFVLSHLEGTPISTERCNKMLADLKQTELLVAGQKVKYADQSVVELSSEQVQLLKRTWQIIKESCDMTQEIKGVIPKINEKITKMEVMSWKMNKYIDAYNGGKFDEAKKVIILKEINENYEILRSDYQMAQKEIQNLSLSIAGQQVKLDLVDAQNTNSIIQSGIMTAVHIFQGVMGRANPVTVSKGVQAGTSQIAKNLDAKQAISRARKELQELKVEIDDLSFRLAAIKVIKQKAQVFLHENGIEVDE